MKLRNWRETSTVAEEPSAMEPEPVIEESIIPETESSNPTQDEDLEKLTKKLLVEKCKSLGLSDKGNRKDLIEQIREHNISSTKNCGYGSWRHCSSCS